MRTCDKPTGCTVGSGKRSCGARLANSCRQGFTGWRKTLAGERERCSMDADELRKVVGILVRRQDELRDRVQATEADLRSSVDDLEERLAAAERKAADLEEVADTLRRANVAILSHAIRRQHLPVSFTFDSALWDRLLDLGGAEACSAVNAEIEQSQAALRRGGAE
jgi:chromosome segregation ATPase